MQLLTVVNGLVTVRLSAPEAALLCHAARHACDLCAEQTDHLLTMAEVFRTANTLASFQATAPPDVRRKIVALMQDGTDNHDYTSCSP